MSAPTWGLMADRTRDRLGTVAPLDVIMVTYNNPNICGLAIKSLLSTWAWYPFRLFIVNNGSPGSIPPIAPDSQAQIHVLQQSDNLGWEGGLRAGLEASDAPFVVFANDDIQIPYASRFWARQLMATMRDPRIGAVGPTSNFVSGLQNVSQQPTYQAFPVSYLIGFFVLMRRAALEQAGGLDLGLPGGDDLDLSIRLRRAGYALWVRNDVFILHHGEVTGRAVHGDRWNSEDMQETTNNALIRKHGLAEWFQTLYQQGDILTDTLYEQHVPELEACRTWVPEGRVLDFGCGGFLTVPWAIGVDQYEGGIATPWRHTSAASVVADVFQPLPMFEDDSADAIVARHILEHAVDLVTVLREWRRILKPGGSLIVAAPNEEIVDGIPMDITHLHGLTPDALRSLAEAVGFRQVAYTPDCGNRLSFVAVYEKVAA